MARKKKQRNQSAAELEAEYFHAANLHWCSYGKDCSEAQMYEALADLWGAVHFARNPYPNTHTNDDEWFV